MLLEQSVDEHKPNLERLVARLFLVTLLVKLPGLSLFPAISLVLALAFFPVVIRPIRASRVTWFIAWTAIVAVVSGVFSSMIVTPTLGTPGDPITIAMMIAWIFSIPLTVGLGVWSAQRIGTVRSLRLVFFGALVSAIVIETPFGWKGSVGAFATLFALSLFAHAPVALTRLVLVGSAALSALNDARFMSVIAIVVLLSTFSNTRFASWVKRAPFRAMVLIFGGFALVAWGAISAMQSGLLGEDIQYRTLRQMSGGRSLIEAGRTEWAASLHLFSINPFGFGVGVQVNQGVASDAVSAVKAAGGDSTANYFRTWVFGQRVDLHSMTADLWYHFGIGGVLFAVACLVLLVVSVPRIFSSIRGAGAMGMFAVLTAVWDLIFSPMGNSDRLIAGLLAAAIFGISAQRPSEWPEMHPPRKEQLSRGNQVLAAARSRRS
ncbi:hypothetical protein [Cryobacterium sp. 5B3]|uniref:hypothetical protein n=1 Tax=Cryobacterium sp. 5B3 TaxID=3048586 RepID=UPI002AB584EF|nr:hypothetical protein [Cryobacterium sp. 5B3]MDY7540926.1 hypothetical protein [Cryobacterium sp. 5B3]